LYESLQLAKNMIESGETDVEKLRAALRAHIEKAPGARIDYVSVADTDTLEELSVIKEKAVALLAVFFGKTRLIDNEVLTAP